MSFVSVSSANSCCKGYEYYLEKKVVGYKEIDKGIYCGVMKGSSSSYKRIF